MRTDRSTIVSSTDNTSESNSSIQVGRVGLSIRYKLLMVFIALLLGAIATFLGLATSLFTQDKLAYVYDLQSTTARSLADQTSSSLAVLAAQLRLLAVGIQTPGTTPEAGANVAERLFEREQQIVRLRIYGRRGDALVLVHEYLNPPALRDTGIVANDLVEASKARPLPLEAVLSQPDELYVSNGSLPPDAALLTVAIAHGPPRNRQVVVAEIRHNHLMRLFERSPLHETWLVDSRGVVLAHPDGKLVSARYDTSSDPLVAEALHSEVEAGVKEYKAVPATAAGVNAGEQEEVEFLGGFAKVPVAGLFVITRTSTHSALTAGEELKSRSLLLGAAVFLAALIASVLFARVMTARLLRLKSATERIGRGDYNVSFPVGGRDEIAVLSRSFAAMVEQLATTHQQLIHSEKLAAFGQLGAGITHEVKNPIAGIVGLAQAAQMKFDDPERVREFLVKIEAQGRHCNEILQRFLTFARQDPPSMGPVDVAELITEVGALVKHQLNVHNVTLKLQTSDHLPPIFGDSSSLQQVLTNLALNAQHAMPEGGKLVITADPAERDGTPGITISVADSGVGIPESLRRRIFEPFFTTKKAGEGTGLGLAVVHGVVGEHSGTISVENTPGGGATFSIWLPAASSAGRSSGGAS